MQYTIINITKTINHLARLWGTNNHRQFPPIKLTTNITEDSLESHGTVTIFDAISEILEANSRAAIGFVVTCHWQVDWQSGLLSDGRFSSEYQRLYSASGHRVRTSGKIWSTSFDNSAVQQTSIKRIIRPDGWLFTTIACKIQCSSQQHGTWQQHKKCNASRNGDEIAQNLENVPVIKSRKSKWDQIIFTVLKITTNK